jgi:hypothetical protein
MLASLIALSLVLQDPAPKSQPPAQSGTPVDAATPERAIRTFILAMATKDAAMLRAVTLPADDLEVLLQGRTIPAEEVAAFKAQIAEIPVHVLKAGEEITLPDNRKFKAGPDHVTPDRAMVMPAGASFPAHLRKIEGRWRVDASPIIASLKARKPAPKTIDPAAIKDKVTLTVGSKIDVQFDQKDKVLSNSRVVENPKDEVSSVHMEFSNQGQGLTLVTKNPFPKDLSFRAIARHKGRKTYIETSIVPVRAGLLSFELWQEPIEELVLFDFKLIDAKP